MKKQIIPCILLAVLAGCTNESELTGGSDYVSRVTITAKDFEAGDAATRTAFEVSASGLAFKWAETDVVGIYPNEGDQVSFPMTAGAGTNSASFDGGGWALKGNYTYAAYFPYSVDNTTQGRTYTALPITYTGQTQSANNSTADMGNFDYMVAKASTPASGNVNFAFEHVGSVLYIQLTAPEAATFTKLTISADEPIFTTEATVNLSDGTLTPTSTSNSISLALDNIAVEAGSTLYAWMQIAPTDASSKALKATLTTSETEIYTVELTGKTFEAGKAYQLKGTPQKEYIISGVEAGHAYVDLGLTSGTLWATTNVGADSPEDWGIYYAWGEVKTKSEWSWSMYKYCDDNEGYTITKYNDDDGKNVLESADDAACVNWKGNWRTPTYEAWHELIENCTWTWTSINGINGQKVTSNANGNSIFLPTASHQYNHYADSDPSCCYGIKGYYWASTLWGGGYGWYTSISNEGVYQTDGLRWAGHTVRPVLR